MVCTIPKNKDIVNSGVDQVKELGMCSTGQNRYGKQLLLLFKLLLWNLKFSDDDWDDKDAAVVCRMLGYNSSFAKAVIGSTFGSVPSTFEMDEVSIIYS